MCKSLLRLRHSPRANGSLGASKIPSTNSRLPSATPSVKYRTRSRASSFVRSFPFSASTAPALSVLTPCCTTFSFWASFTYRPSQAVGSDRPPLLPRFASDPLACSAPCTDHAAHPESGVIEARHFTSSSLKEHQSFRLRGGTTTHRKPWSLWRPPGEP